MVVLQQITACRSGLSQEGVLFKSIGERMGHVCSVRKLFPTSLRLLVCFASFSQENLEEEKKTATISSEQISGVISNYYYDRNGHFSSVDGVETAARQNK